MDATTGSPADDGAATVDDTDGNDAVDGFDEVFGTAIENAVRRAVDGVGRNPLASLDVPTEPSSAAPSDPPVDTTPTPLPQPGITDPYELLGVSRRAPWPEITAAYKRRAREWHPDGAGEHERERREELLRDLNGAYAELRVRRGK